MSENDEMQTAGEDSPVETPAEAPAAAPVGQSRDGERVGFENLRVLENINVELTVVVGSAEMKIRDLLRLNEGSVIELDRLAGDPLDILANGTIIAKGEVVMVGERFGIRFSEIVDPEKRVENI
ncbi:MAG: Flagellar motor switch protein FliN [Rhodobiaceae bacterium UBA7378]|nr:MAG: Flagellar motor switch protein FliN [Rhodobiaceae bacterium UBA7378]